MAKSKKEKSTTFQKKLFTFIKKNKYQILVGLILLLALSLRFYNFFDRWGLGNDEARDVAIAREALARHEIPLIGSFSSAGPFVFGPFFYWYIMLSYMLVPFVYTAPWILLELIGVGTVVILMYCAKKIAGNNFALVVGLLAATSPQLVVRSLLLGQHSFIAPLAALMILFLLFLIEKKKLIFAFLMGVAIGAAINFHTQAINLLIFSPVIFFIPGITWRYKIIGFLVTLAGVLLSLSPLIIWDAPQQFANFRNILDYLLIGQHRIYVPNSWRLFLFNYLPHYWAFVVGGKEFISLILMSLVGLLIPLAIYRRKFPNILFYLLIPFAILLLVNRYYKGERSESYLIYFLPMILLFTSYAIYTLFQKGVVPRKLLRLCQIFGVVTLTIITSMHLFVLSRILLPSPVAIFERTIDELTQKMPGRKFVIYDYKGRISATSQPLSLLLHKRGLTDKEGVPIGVSCYDRCINNYPRIISTPVLIIDLSSDTKHKTEKGPKRTWINVNQEAMYDDLIGWSKRHELTSTFSFSKYIESRFK